MVLPAHCGGPTNPCAKLWSTGACCLSSLLPITSMLMSRLMVLTGVMLSDVQVTQLGHVKDLATAFVKVLSHPKASREVFNISGER